MILGRIRSIKPKNDKFLMETLNAPKIEDLSKITPAQAAEYVRYVAELRHQQRRYFATRKPDALEASKQMEKELDRLNAHLLDPIPRLF